MSSTLGLSALTSDQLILLLAVFKDCKEFYSSRRLFDDDYRRLERTDLMTLYRCWKRINYDLAAGEGCIRSEVLLNWSLVPASSAKEVQAYRQVHGLFSRLDGICDCVPALDSYARRVSNARGTVPSGLREKVKSLIEAWLGPCPSLEDLIPRHGPGAVAERLRDSTDKRTLRVLYHQLIPFGGERLLHLNPNHMQYEPYSLEIQRHPITRVIAVPKDISKPRIISCEPLTMQFLQQGLSRYMMARLEHCCPYVRFSDQSYNASLARDLSCATLDMSDASDTVSRRMVYNCFPIDWRNALFALRSHFALLPSGERVPLRAFAPMGSALCFPVESVMFAAVTVASILTTYGAGFVRANSRRIAVYGDDIIVPAECAHDVLIGLRTSGFTPNLHKCCISGRFRESCGAEWFDGSDVTVVRPHSLSSLHIVQEPHKILRELPMVTHAKALLQRGFLSAAQVLADSCLFPVAIGQGEGYAPPELSWKRVGRIRYNRDLQRLEQQATLPVQVARPSDASTGYSALFMHMCSGWSSEQVSTPRVKPKDRWVLAAPLMER